MVDTPHSGSRARVHFVVTPAADGWRVLREGDVIARHRTRGDAEADAARRARQAFDAGEPVQIETRLGEGLSRSSAMHGYRRPPGPDRFHH